ncbi:MAG TPA: S-adenosylmethionine-dependent methyltransferase [Desulfobacteraceae bacterium]|nr:SAM-dependent methyltransferase [Deltaproteobacteria bacterium]MBW2355950.1 SAM-dependent methyltransferase [Deltaproteobacteria bacterium]RLB98546.1 MAG: tRNA (N6-threonylcarbamoyladenosine(37)-N6)-methyltransferase TrmO [Deltaproteobacteria bacterium]HDI59313.1 S-adenosylmethionine-dependent methyltransferase [Desulfobacteraceae bacterium]
MTDAKPEAIVFHPIGRVRHGAGSVPRHWSVSDVEGELVLDPCYTAGLGDIQPGQRIVVLFHFDRSAPFEPGLLRQRPPHRDREVGVFSICSPRRPNPIGLSVLEVMGRDENRIRVRGIDMFDGTPLLDIKPFVSTAAECPSTDRRDDR